MNECNSDMPQHEDKIHTTMADGYATSNTFPREKNAKKGQMGSLLPNIASLKKKKKKKKKGSFMKTHLCRSSNIMITKALILLLISCLIYLKKEAVSLKNSSCYMSCIQNSFTVGGLMKITLFIIWLT